MEPARLRFDAHLLDTLGRQYRSSEEAIKELIVNAWDADATIVNVALSEPFSEHPIVVSDNGHGMTRAVLEHQFLNVGYDRRQHGMRTPKNRVVRGSKGIGKFAGLTLAEIMNVSTVWMARQSQLTLNREELEKQGHALESLDIVIATTQTTDTPGTTVTLSRLRPGLSFPSEILLSRLLLREFGVRDDFTVYINGDAVTARALDAIQESVDLELSDGSHVTVTVWISERPGAIREPGFLLRINGRAIGEPSFFGAESDNEIPRSLRNRFYAEVDADYLVDEVMSNWAGIVENSTAYQSLTEACRVFVKSRLLSLREAEGGQEQDKFLNTYREQIERLPLPRREVAMAALLRVFNRLYDDADDRKHVVAELVLDAFEQDEYWILVKRIQEMSKSDAHALAEVLEAWGFYEVNGIVTRARQRLDLLEQFEVIAGDDSTLELDGVHKALLNNLWLLDDKYELLKSNTTLKRIVQDVFGRKYAGAHPAKRPDLLLAGLQNSYLLVELKRPREQLDRANTAQAHSYRDELMSYLPRHERIDVVVIGGSVAGALISDPIPQVMTTSYRQVLDTARGRLKWLVDNLIDMDEDSLTT